MSNFGLTETLLRDHQRELEASAARHRVGRHTRAVAPSTMRGRAGWILVRAGLRLARAGSVRAKPRTEIGSVSCSTP